MARTTRSRDVKSAAPSPSPSLSRRSMRNAQKEEPVPVTPATVPESTDEEDEEGDEGRGAGAETDAGTVEEDEAGEEAEEGAEAEEDGEAEDGQEAEEEVTGKKMTLDERKAKLKELRLRMNQSTAANRRDLVADHQKSKVTARELQRLEKQKKLAQTLRLKADAEANGEDLERTKAWTWSIEQNERWEKKMAEQAERSDTNFHNANDDAHKKYAKNVRNTKADLLSYNRAKEAALGLEPGTLAPAGTSSDQLAAAGPSSSKGLTAAEDLYRSAETLSYGEHKPSDDAVDRVMAKINKDIGGKRKQKDDDDEGGDVTYINKRNKVFNKKIARYFDKYTKEIRANLERGTAL